MKADSRSPRTTLLGAGIAQALVLVILYLPAGLVVPPTAWLILNGAGVAGGIVGLARARRWRYGPVAVPVVSVVLWFAFVAGGAALFDWSA